MPPPSGSPGAPGVPAATEGRGLAIKAFMRAVLKSLDPVMLNFAANLLEQEGIDSVIFDTHASVMDGSMGFLPRRLMVSDGDFSRAADLLRAALPEAM